jgi:plasmid stability protein
MRTTITIDDELYRSLKQRAAASGRTVGQTIEDALRATFASRAGADPAGLPELPRYGGSGTLPGVDLTSNAALRDVMDAGSAVDALR